MNEPIDPELAELIAADRAGEEDPPIDKLRARLLLSVGVAGVATAALTTTAAEAAKMTVKAKVLAAVAIAGVSAGSGAAVTRYVYEKREPIVIEKIVERIVEVPAAPSPSPSLRSAVPSPARAERDAELQAERQLIEAARTALLRKEPEHALGSIATHKKRFPNGRLAEERDSVEIQVLKALHRDDDAAAASKRFKKRYPDSFFNE